MTSIVSIVGVGSTEFSKRSGRSEGKLAMEAILAAIADTGVERHEIDGLVTVDQDHTSASMVARNLGLDRTTFFARSEMGGGGGCGAIALARLAILGGAASTVVCYRAMNERSEKRFGVPSNSDSIGNGPPTSWDIDMSWNEPFGYATPASWIAPSARRFMHDRGVTSEDLGRVAVLQRNYAATNPAAWFFNRPITLEDHQTSRMIADPLRLLDCCQESDGAVAFVLTAKERASRLDRQSIRILAAAQAIGPRQFGMASPYQDDLATAVESTIVGEQLWDSSRLSPSAVDVAVLYDHFSFSVLMQLEDLGFCGPGEGKHWVKSGDLGLTGRLPVNTHGGQLGEAYMHGFNGIAEAVRQLRGEAANQVVSPSVALVTSGSHVPTSALLLQAS